jgi:DNA mismatch endonuclease (patch repair protein)
MVALGDGVRVPYPEPKDEAATRVGQGNRRTGTKPEVALRSALHRRGLRFRKDRPVDAGRRKVRPDIVFTKARVAVFVDGCFWHGCPDHKVVPRSNRDYWVPKLRRNEERDREVDRALASAGWLVLRVWEHEDVEEASRRVVEALAKQEARSGGRAS